MLGAIIGAGFGHIVKTGITFTVPVILQRSGLTATCITITISTKEIAAAGAIGLLYGSIMFSKRNPGMSNRSPRTWVTKEEGIEAMNIFNGDANKAAEYIMNNHRSMWQKGAGTDFSAIKKWLDRIIRKLLGW